MDKQEAAVQPPVYAHLKRGELVLDTELSTKVHALENDVKAVCQTPLATPQDCIRGASCAPWELRSSRSAPKTPFERRTADWRSAWL